MAMLGADADALRETARRFAAASHLLRRRNSELTATLRVTPWSGADADVSRDEWVHRSIPALTRASEFMEALGARLLDQAAAQQRASTSDGARGIGTAPAPAGERWMVMLGDVASDVVDDLRDLAGEVEDFLDSLFGDRGSVTDAGSPQAPSTLTGLRPSRFGDPVDGRAGLVDAMLGFADSGRIARDEIEIRALDNGRYVVVLPGVTDLSDGIDEFVEALRREGLLGAPEGARDAHDMWADNDEPTVRKMRYAFEAAVRDDTTVNEYSTVVIAAMRAVGVPSGAEVMLVGHSFGAYTAVDLAAEPSFNAAAGVPTGGYQVNVTHVVAAGAETDWRFDEIPGGTSTLVLNNRWDAVYRAEDLLHRNGSSTEPGHLEQVFWGGREGYGHDEHNYVDWVRDATDRDELNAWLAGLDARYATGGTRVSVRVPDPHLPSR